MSRFTIFMGWLLCSPCFANIASKTFTDNTYATKASLNNYVTATQMNQAIAAAGGGGGGAAGETLVVTIRDAEAAVTKQLAGYTFVFQSGGVYVTATPTSASRPSLLYCIRNAATGEIIEGCGGGNWGATLCYWASHMPADMVKCTANIDGSIFESYIIPVLINSERGVKISVTKIM